MVTTVCEMGYFGVGTDGWNGWYRSDAVCMTNLWKLGRTGHKEFGRAGCVGRDRSQVSSSSPLNPSISRSSFGDLLIKGVLGQSPYILMEGNTNWQPNEQGGDSAANNAIDWRSQHEPELRKKVLSKIVEKLKQYCPTHEDYKIIDIASKFEEKFYSIASDKHDYIRKLSEKLQYIDKTYNGKFGSSVNRTNTRASAQVVMNQAQSLPASLPYTQTSTSQQWLPQNTQSNLNIPGSSGLPSQAPITVSGAQNVNIHVGEGVQINILPGSQRPMQGRQQLLPQQQQHQMNQIRHGNLRPSHMQQQVQPPQQQHHPQSLLKQPIQQSFPQSSLPSSSQQTSMQQNSQSLPRHQFPTQRVSSSHQQQMILPSQEQKRQEQEQLISQLMNIPNTQQNHPTSRQNNGAQQGAFRVSSSQQNNNLQNMHPQRLNNASALPLQQQQNVSRVQQVGQSQPMMSQQYRAQLPMQQHFDSVQNNTNRFQEGSSLRQTQNITDQQNQQHQLQRAPLANPSTSQESTGKTVNANAGDWQEETYQKIKHLKEMYLPVLSLMLQRVKDKLRRIESLPPEKLQYQSIDKLKGAILSIEQMIVFLHVHRINISEKHRDKFSAFENHILRLTKNQTMVPRPTQQQQGHFPPSQSHQTALQSQSSQVHVSQSLDNDQMSSRLMPSSQNAASSSIMPHSLQTRPKLEPRDENNIMASSGNVMLPSVKQNPQAVPSNISSVQSLLQQKQQNQLQQPQQVNQQHQIPTSQLTNEMNDVRMRQRVNIKAGLLQQQVSSSPGQAPKPQSNVSSPQIQHHSSPQLVDQQILPATVNKTETPLMSGGLPFVAPSPIPGDPERPISVESPVSRVEIKSTLDSSSKLGTEEHPPLSVPPEPITERPIDRLIKAFQAASPKSLAESVSEMSSVISMVDRFAGSFHSGGGSRAGLGEDLSERTRNLTTHEETNLSKRMKRSISTVPRVMSSQIDSYEQFSSLESEVDSTASSGSKVNNIAHGCALLQEIKETNRRLVETVVEICDEDASGTIVTCTYAPVALSATFKDHYKSGKISQIQPLRLLVPMDYPLSSPIILEDFPFDTSVHKYEDLSARTRSRFSLSMRELSEPGSVKEIAKTWNDCARATMVEYAERHGGGTFSSKYGAWETVLRAS
ncbi:Mediator complex subunit 15 KIX domain [Arabidopsis thaliana x Arabidopsis arenosa]|uniref:Mediator complex subunit 15 KIX domain n=1 Tax=Arabidopsis thaliana x Arabidopsis arenosa TaxID=1240361 RepID=A0A8T1ZKT3_9BRAS|nr:Mediator complex subunit 15 KIX domain [Arabidopsis thaliana x Arabidopsis arenosa]